MSIEYLKSQICEELEGSCDYIKKAIELKSTKPKWSSQLYDMANGELEHAKTLVRFFDEKYDEITSAYKEDTTPKYLKDAKDEVTSMYEEMYPKIRYLMEMFSK